MWANAVIYWSWAVLRIPLNIIFLITTTMSGIISAIPLINIPWQLSAFVLWHICQWPLLGLGWAWSKSPSLVHPILLVLAWPLAISGLIVLGFFGAMDMENQHNHLMRQAMCQQWPWMHIETSREAGDPIPLVTAIQIDDKVGFISAIIRLCDQIVSGR